MSKLDTLDVWLDSYNEQQGCACSWLEAEKLNEKNNPKHKRFTTLTNKVCDAQSECHECTYQTPYHIREAIKEIPDGITNANPSGPF